MYCYDLTTLIGDRRNELREITVATVDVKPKTFGVALASSVVGLIVMALVWPLIGYYAVLALPLVVGAAEALFVMRTNDSRRLPQYRALMDSRKARKQVGTFVVGTRTVDPSVRTNGTLSQRCLVGTMGEPDVDVSNKIESLLNV